LHLVNKPGEFNTADIAAVETVTPQIAIAVQLARSVARISARQRVEGILAEAAVAIASGLPSRESLLPAFDHLGAVVGGLPGRSGPGPWSTPDPPDRRGERRARGTAGDRRPVPRHHRHGCLSTSRR
jgi:hypothetical protein